MVMINGGARSTRVLSLSGYLKGTTKAEDDPNRLVWILCGRES